MSKNVNQGDAYHGVVQTDHAGVRLLVSADAIDHGNMRAGQLAALLRLISGEGHDVFMRQDRATQDGVLWLASSLANEVLGMLPLMESEARSSAVATSDKQTVDDATGAKKNMPDEVRP
jgi:hypothetical protein